MYIIQRWKQYPIGNRKVLGWKPRDKEEYDFNLTAALEQELCLEPISIVDDVDTTTNSIDRRCEQIEVAIKEVATQCQHVEKSNKASQQRQQGKLQDLTQSRREARTRGENVSTISKRIQRESRAVSRARRRAEVATILENMQGLRSIISVGQVKSRDHLCSIQDKNGVTHSEKNAIVEVFATFYEDLYSSREVLRAASSGYRSSEAIAEPFTMEELTREMKTLKGGKSADCSGIVAEMLKCPSEALSHALLELYNSLLLSQALPPESWRRSTISVIFKDGDAQLPKNYRPISILSILYKLFSRLLLGRVKPILERAQTADQAGFRAGFSCSDHLFCLAQLHEKAREWRQNLWIVTIDFMKAFDMINHSALLSSLRAQGLPNHYVELIEAFYSNQSATMKIDRESRPFRILRGVRQGDPMSPVLFNAALEEVMRKCKAKWSTTGLGIRVDEQTERLTNLRFADDILLISPTLPQLTEMIGDLAMFASQLGLQVHPDKTKILGNVLDTKRGTDAQRVAVGGLNIEVVPLAQSVKYLGRRFSFHNTNMIEVENRINGAWRKFNILKHILCNRRYPLPHRLRLFDAAITPSALYGSETWTLTRDLQHKLRKAQRHMIRLMLRSARRKIVSADGSDTSSSSTGCSDDSDETALDQDELEPWVDWIKRVTREADRAIEGMGIQPWLEQVRRKQHRWAGHVVRRDDGRWSVLILDWQPERGARHGEAGYGRRRARPNKRWEDDLEVHAQHFTGQSQISWRILAADRKTWKSMEDDFATGMWRQE